MLLDRSLNRLMDITKTVDARVTLPAALYEVIEQRAQVSGHSINKEIVGLLSILLSQPTDELEQEFADWEAASDEDWQRIETMLVTEAN